MCNSDRVDKQTYQSKLRKRALAMVTAGTYRKDLNLLEERQALEGYVHFSAEQLARERQGKADGEEEEMERFFQQEEKRLERVARERLIAPLVKKALVDLLIECKDRHWITRRGNVLDIFMTGDPVYNRACARILLRIIHSLPTSLKCVETIKKNMILFAEVSNEVEASPRVVEWNYSWRLLMAITKLRYTKGVECYALMYSLAKLNKTVWEEGNYVGYYFGSVNLHQWSNAFLAKERAREALLNEIDGRPVVSADIVAERNRQTLAQLQERSRQRRRVEEEQAVGDDPEQGAEEVVPVPALHSPAKAWDEESPKWSNEMKLELLRVWICKSPNPMVRADTPSGKGVYKEPMKELMEQAMGITVSGEKFTLKSLVSERHGVDTLAGMLQGVQKKGLSGQKSKAPGKGGLVHILDEWLEGKEDKSVDFIRKSWEEIVQYARDSYCRV